MYEEKKAVRRLQRTVSAWLKGAGESETEAWWVDVERRYVGDRAVEYIARGLAELSYNKIEALVA
jgi:hypothetical protein